IFLYATEKLQMPLAARRLFDGNGREITHTEDIRPQTDYYVSSGENFKNPLTPIKVQTEYVMNSTWTMKGIKTSAVKPESFTTRTTISKRLAKQIKLNINLMIFENGFGGNDAMNQILIDTVLKEKFEKFLEECTKKIGLTTHAKKAYNYCVDDITSLKTFFESEDNMTKTVHGLLIGPIWISKGERFRPTGAYTFLQIHLRETKEKLKETKLEQKRVRIFSNSKKRKKKNL
ncbi:unnamed protein product, partial [Didymodactylos carnosus]